MNVTRGSRFQLGIAAASTALAALAACGGLPKPAKPPLPVPAPIWAQNWSPEQQHAWWRGSQGSRLIPLAWLRALEAPDSATLFLDRAYFDRFGYLWGSDSNELPIGFALDSQSDALLELTRLRWFEGQDDKQPWVGLNCAACHTNRIEHRGKWEFVDGAPTLADFQGFTDALTDAMEKTAADPTKFDRFAARVIEPRRAGEADDSRVERDKALLAGEFQKLLDHQVNLRNYNRTDIVYGHGRLDAVGHILNKVAMLNRSWAMMNGKPGLSQFRGEPDAPVSYPFIWNANQHDFVQWNGLVPNQKLQLGKRDLDLGALVRNTSEVIGVFAEVETVPYPGLNGYRSSVRIENLTSMETQLGKLMSPAWPAQWGTEWRIDAGLKEKGRALFERACADCHRPLDRTDLTTPIQAQMTPIWGHRGVRTDPSMVCNTFTFQARGGILTGTFQNIFAGPPLPPRAQTAAYLQTQAIGVLLRQKKDIIKVAFRTLLGRPSEIRVDRELQAAVVETVADQPREREERLEDCRAAARSPRSSPSALRTLAYKARPLNGIWATAPYLHNGSVRSLYQLLLPPAQRETRFWVGNHEFDPKEVGFVNGPSSRWPNGSWFQTRNSDGPIRGSSNWGHNYQISDPPCAKDDTKCARERSPVQPRDFTDPERWALVEYMKSL